MRVGCQKLQDGRQAPGNKQLLLGTVKSGNFVTEHNFVTTA